MRGALHFSLYPVLFDHEAVNKSKYLKSSIHIVDHNFIQILNYEHIYFIIIIIILAWKINRLLWYSTVSKQ